MSGPDRVAADNPAVETVRATLARAGRTDRPKVALPESFPVPDGPVRLTLDGTQYHAPVERGLDDTPQIPGAYDNARAAREREPPDRLAEWVDGTDLSFGRSVLVDVVEEGTHYGLRAPGESAVYEVATRDEGLAAIAEEIERGDDRAP